MDVMSTQNMKMEGLHFIGHLQYGYAEVVQILIQNRCDVNSKDKNRNTALHLASFKWASSNGHAEVVQMSDPEWM